MTHALSDGLSGCPHLCRTATYDEPMTVTLNTHLKPRTGAVEGQDPEERRTIEASGATYQEARAALLAQVPEGWIVIGVKRW